MAIQKDVDDNLAKILTEDQQKQLEEIKERGGRGGKGGDRGGNPPALPDKE